MAHADAPLIVIACWLLFGCFLGSIAVKAEARLMVDHGRQGDGWRAAPRPMSASQLYAHWSHFCLGLSLGLRSQWDLPDSVFRLVPLLSFICAHPSAWGLTAA